MQHPHFFSTMVYRRKGMILVEPKSYSGIYPHLAVTNEADSECGIGAIVAWNNKLWYLTYTASAPQGSDDKLYCLDEDLNVKIYPGSVGGTHANRMIHRESNQMNIGLYLIDAENNVRVISPQTLQGRCTASARHLADPKNKIYIFTMEEGLYEVDVNTLEVKALLDDEFYSEGEILPGEHGKGGYTGQGRLIYANNGMGGVLAQWHGKGDPRKIESWVIIDRNKYTEITGPGGICGSSDTAPIWALGWDEKSVLLRVCENGKWYRYRLPKASYTYDADHGCYTEWPRIRSIGRQKLLMDMHGMFYEFPDSFNTSNTAGLSPVARHLKMVVDFTEWNGNLVMAADDASVMQNPFLGRSQSNLWFGKFEDLHKMGKPAGWGGVWNNENIKAGEPSEPFMCCGFDRRVLHLSHDSDATVSFTLEIDRKGTGIWEEYTAVCVNAHGYQYFVIPENLDACWIRLTLDRDADSVSAYFHYSSSECKHDDTAFNSLARIETRKEYSQGIIYPKDDEAMTLGFAADVIDSSGNVVGSGYYEIGENMVLRRVKNSSLEKEIRTKFKITQDYEVDDSSVIMHDEEGRRYRLPKSSIFDELSKNSFRCIREVVTERFLMNVHGSFYELPRQASGGLIKIKPICTHNRMICDFASWRGMLVLAGNINEAVEDEHYIRSDDNKTGLWFGNVDDLWKMGAPRGEGGPCSNTPLVANEPSDPYLMTGYDNKSVSLAHDSKYDVEFTIEVDYMANHTWHVYDKIIVKPGEKAMHNFPKGFNAHWVRVTVDRDCKATAWFIYGAE
jgi:hypothetical protein